MQLTIPRTGGATMSYGPLINIRIKNFLFEGYAYNFWKDDRVWALAIQFAIK
jgi:hypothetical protein